MDFLKNYFSSTPEDKRKSSAISILAGLDHLHSQSPKIAAAIVSELQAQRSNLKMIASENYCSLAVQLAMGNWLTDKYSEGAVRKRFYAGCENVDTIEEMAVHELKEIYGCDHAYVQPHSGADANLVALWSILVGRVQSKELEKLGAKSPDALSVEDYEKVRQVLVSQKMLGMGLNSGGHLTHGYRHNISSKMIQSFSYEVNPETGLLDYAEIERRAKEVQPLVLIAGYSAYSRLINFAKMREIADSVGAVLWVDMAHFSGLVAGKVMQGEYNPIPYAQMVTSTTHKTLRGPRGGMVLCQSEFKEMVDKGCPLALGGPLPHVMAAKAIAFQEANTKEFQNYSQQIVKNSQALAEAMKERGAKVLTGGTDNHMAIVDVQTSYGISGRQAELALKEANLTINRNTVPGDVNGPWYTSGIRFGTPALTTLGLKEAEMERIGGLLDQLLRACEPVEGSKAKYSVDSKVMEHVRGEVKEILKSFPLYPELVIDEVAAPHVF
ncbi:MAG: glycine hydroxymethyltransferase [Candidatus Algichlamydia australiensis]|nr:glycine hydroxymethyltransferase [Chlamydiales bacterium]